VARGLSSPDVGLLGRGTRFVMAGVAVASIYSAITILLAETLGLPFQVALAIGFATALACHFALQRFFVWRSRDAFMLSLHQQVGRYLIVAGSQYGTTAAVTSTVPSALDLPAWAVYAVWTVLVSASAFIVFGRGVFHAARSRSTESSPTDPGRRDHA
jgi:putative flippase GtrA